LEKRRGFIWKSLVFLATSCGQSVLENKKRQTNSSTLDVKTTDNPEDKNIEIEETNELPLVTSTELKGVSIGLDVGHGMTEKGSQDPGAIGNGIEENSQNRKLAHKLSAELTKMGAKVKIFDYPPGSPRKSLKEKGEDAAKDNDYMISIHHNAAGSSQAQFSIALYGHTGKATSKRLAEKVSNSFQTHLLNKKIIPGSTRASSQAQALGVLSGANLHCKACILLEPYFLTHSQMKQNIADKVTPEVAKAVAEGVATYHAQSKSAIYSAMFAVSDFLAPKEWPYEPDPLYEGH